MREVHSTIDMIDFLGYYRFKYTFEKAVLALAYISIIVITVIGGAVAMRIKWYYCIPLYALCVSTGVLWRSYNLNGMQKMLDIFKREKLGKEIHILFTHAGMKYAVGNTMYKMYQYENLFKVRETKYFIFVWHHQIGEYETPIIIHKSRIENNPSSVGKPVYIITEIKNRCKDYKKYKAMDLTWISKPYKKYYVPL